MPAGGWNGKLQSVGNGGWAGVISYSAMADAIKASGAVSMFPAMADEWLQQMQAQNGWSKFQPEDFRRLRAQYGVSWVVMQQPRIAGLDCPYRNAAVLVCRVD